MEYGCDMRTGRKQRTSCPALPKIALHGDFPLGFDHFISKIADGKQQPENPIPTTPGFPYALPFRTMDFPAFITIFYSKILLLNIIFLAICEGKKVLAGGGDWGEGQRGQDFCRSF